MHPDSPPSVLLGEWLGTRLPSQSLDRALIGHQSGQELLAGGHMKQQLWVHLQPAKRFVHCCMAAYTYGLRPLENDDGFKPGLDFEEKKRGRER